MAMCTSLWPSKANDADNGECVAPAVEQRDGEQLCQEHVDVDNARKALGLGPLIS